MKHRSGNSQEPVLLVGESAGVVDSLHTAINGAIKVETPNTNTINKFNSNYNSNSDDRINDKAANLPARIRQEGSKFANAGSSAVNSTAKVFSSLIVKEKLGSDSLSEAFSSSSAKKTTTTVACDSTPSSPRNGFSGKKLQDSSPRSRATHWSGRDSDLRQGAQFAANPQQLKKSLRVRSDNGTDAHVSAGINTQHGLPIFASNSSSGRYMPTNSALFPPNSSNNDSTNYAVNYNNTVNSLTSRDTIDIHQGITRNSSTKRSMYSDRHSFDSVSEKILI